MPGRKIPIVEDQIYHVVNRGIASQKIFLDKRCYWRTIDLLRYYRFNNPPFGFSRFVKLSPEKKLEILSAMENKNDYLVKLIAYCLMPTHFHLLLKEIKPSGIAKFVSQVCNGYTRYLNTRKESIGPILQGKFKDVLINTDEQLMHVSRYIHLNPYSARLIKDLDILESYPYSSLPEYLDPTVEGICNGKQEVLSLFKAREDYRKFVFDQADYQRNLQDIKRISLDYN